MFIHILNACCTWTSWSASRWYSLASKSSFASPPIPASAPRAPVGNSLPQSTGNSLIRAVTRTSLWKSLLSWPFGWQETVLRSYVLFYVHFLPQKCSVCAESRSRPGAEESVWTSASAASPHTHTRSSSSSTLEQLHHTHTSHLRGHERKHFRPYNGDRVQTGS